ncbi:MAG: DUF3619 family protein [Burkholderiaceae bacterium]|nr:DUF3619 family protein [Burkholderiaceae bacterium]
MNVVKNLTPIRADALETRFGLRLAARLSEGVNHLPHDVTERLRFARETALARRLSAAALTSTMTVGFSTSSTLSLGGGPSSGKSWWTSLTAILPLLALVGGLYLIGHFHAREQIAAAAEIDAALLSDDLPPAAYSDPGFVEFLKAARD